MVFKAPRCKLKNSSAFSLLLKAPLMAKTKGNIMAMLIKVRSIL